MQNTNDNGFWRGRVDQDGLITEIYNYIYNVQLDLTTCSTPTTVIFERGWPKILFVYERGHGGQHILKKYLGKDITEDRVIKYFCKNVEECDVVAEYTTQTSGEFGEEAELNFEYMTKSQLKAFLGTRAEGGTGILQHFVAPKTVDNRAIQVIWSPSSLFLSIRKNKSLMKSKGSLRDKCSTYDGDPAKSTFSNVTPFLRRRMEKTTAEFSKVFTKSENRPLRGLVALFKIDNTGSLFLTKCLSIRVRMHIEDYTKAPINLAVKFLEEKPIRDVYIVRRDAPSSKDRNRRHGIDHRDCGYLSVDLNSVQSEELNLLENAITAHLPFEEPEGRIVAAAAPHKNRDPLFLISIDDAPRIDTQLQHDCALIDNRKSMALDSQLMSTEDEAAKDLRMKYYSFEQIQEELREREAKIQQFLLEEKKSLNVENVAVDPSQKVRLVVMEFMRDVLYRMLTTPDPREFKFEIPETLRGSMTTDRLKILQRTLQIQKIPATERTVEMYFFPERVLIEDSDLKKAAWLMYPPPTSEEPVKHTAFAPRRDSGNSWAPSHRSRQASLAPSQHASRRPSVTLFTGPMKRRHKEEQPYRRPSETGNYVIDWAAKRGGLTARDGQRFNPTPPETQSAHKKNYWEKRVKERRPVFTSTWNINSAFPPLGSVPESSGGDTQPKVVTRPSTARKMSTVTDVTEETHGPMMDYWLQR